MTFFVLISTAPIPAPPKPGPGGFVAQPRCMQKPIRDVDFNNCPGPKTTRFYFNSKTNNCQGFLGCENANPMSNNFAMKTVCQQQCIGYTPTETPPESSGSIENRNILIDLY